MWCIFLFTLIVIVSILLLSARSQRKTKVLVYNNDIPKSLSDKSTYKIISLKNNLRVMLMSNPDINKSSAAITVGAGSFSDDKKFQGLAHLSEHMLFLGSEENKDSNKLNNYLAKYFGYSNAFTEDESTTFFFEVNNEGLNKGIYLFSSFFKGPLFDQSFLDKEINAVSSENDKNFNNDSWKKMELIKFLSSKDSIYHNFTCGSSKTLAKGEELRLKLKEYYNNFFYPENMRLAIISNQSLNSMESMASDYFSNIGRDYGTSTKTVASKEKILKTNVYDKTNAFSKELLGKIIWWNKASSGQELSINFHTSSIRKFEKEKPFTYVSYILNYKGENSLYRELLNKEYITDFSSRITEEKEDFSIYTINLSLTSKGLSNINEIIRLIFDYINHFKTLSINDKIFDEIKKILKENFRFIESTNESGNLAANYSRSMLYLREDDKSLNNILLSDYSITMNKEITSKFINELKPENSLILIGTNSLISDELNNLLSLNLSTEEKEEWFETKFKQRPLTSEDILKYSSIPNKSSNNALRPPNQYISQEKKLIKCESKEWFNDTCSVEKESIKPTTLIDNPYLKYYYKYDTSFSLPKVITTIKFKFNSFQNPIHYIYFSLFYLYYNDMIDISLSDASESGNSYSITIQEKNIIVKIKSYSDVHYRMINLVIEKFKNTLTRENFEYYKEKTIQEIKSDQNKKPYEKAVSIFHYIVNSNYYLDSDLLDIINNKSFNIKFEDYKNNIDAYIKSSMMQSLTIGYLANVTQVVSLYDLFVNNTYGYDSNLKNKKELSNVFNNENFEITTPITYLTKNNLPTEKEHSTLNVFQVNKYLNINKSLIASIISLLWDNIFYDILRTDMQLGYIVNSSRIVFDKSIYYIFLVQGSKKEPNLVDNLIDDIIKTKLSNIINDLDDYKLNKVKDNIRTELLKDYTNLSSKSDEIWNEIINNTFNFNRRKLLLNQIDYVTINDIKKEFDVIFFKNPNKLSIQIYSGESKVNIPTLLSTYDKAYYLNKSIPVEVVDSKAKINKQ